MKNFVIHRYPRKKILNITNTKAIRSNYKPIRGWIANFQKKIETQVVQRIKSQPKCIKIYLVAVDPRCERKTKKKKEEEEERKKKKEWQGERKTYLSQFRLTDAAMEAVACERWPVWTNQPLLPFPEQGLLSAKNALAKRRNFYRRASRLCKLCCYKEDAGVG
ncbi:hypothetical protein ANTPLA_LOCUS3065 [Anthophora plagiata]